MYIRLFLFVLLPLVLLGIEVYSGQNLDIRSRTEIVVVWGILCFANPRTEYGSRTNLKREFFKIFSRSIFLAALFYGAWRLCVEFGPPAVEFPSANLTGLAGFVACLSISLTLFVHRVSREELIDENEDTKVVIYSSLSGRIFTRWLLFLCGTLVICFGWSYFWSTRNLSLSAIAYVAVGTLLVSLIFGREAFEYEIECGVGKTAGSQPSKSKKSRKSTSGTPAPNAGRKKKTVDKLISVVQRLPVMADTTGNRTVSKLKAIQETFDSKFLELLDSTPKNELLRNTVSQLYDFVDSGIQVFEAQLPNDPESFPVDLLRLTGLNWKPGQDLGCVQRPAWLSKMPVRKKLDDDLKEDIKLCGFLLSTMVMRVDSIDSASSSVEAPEACDTLDDKAKLGEQLDGMLTKSSGTPNRTPSSNTQLVFDPFEIAGEKYELFIQPGKISSASGFHFSMEDEFGQLYRFELSYLRNGKHVEPHYEVSEPVIMIGIGPFGTRRAAFSTLVGEHSVGIDLAHLTDWLRVSYQLKNEVEYIEKIRYSGLRQREFDNLNYNIRQMDFKPWYKTDLKKCAYSYILQLQYAAYLLKGWRRVDAEAISYAETDDGIKWLEGAKMLGKGWRKFKRPSSWTFKLAARLETK